MVNRSGLPWLNGVFGHSKDRVARYEQVMGRKVDLLTVFPTRDSWGSMMNTWWADTAPAGFTGVLDVGLPLYPQDGSMAAAARDGYAAQWRQIGKTIHDRYPGSLIRLAWEFNIYNWYYAAKPDNVDQWKEAFRHAANGLRAGGPSLEICWCPNEGRGSTLRNAADAWPGDAYVDVVGVDAYDWYPPYNSDANWAEHRTKDQGWKYWVDFARARGKQFALCEYGPYPASPEAAGDNPKYINYVLPFLEQHKDIVHSVSYFDEPAAYIRSSIADGQVPKVRDALKVQFARVAAGTDPDPEPTPDDKLHVAWTDSTGLTSTYHLFTSEVAAPRKGLVVYFDGDGQYGYLNPDQSWALGGPNGIVKRAGDAGYATLAIRAPAQANTWWRAGTDNARYAAELILRVTAELNAADLVFVGYSGGAQLITKFLIRRHAPAFPVPWATFVLGGGGAPPNHTPNVTGKRMHWHTGLLDDGRDGDGYNALNDARAGANWYRDAGATVTTEWPAGVRHEDYGGRMGDIIHPFLTGANPDPDPKPSQLAITGVEATGPDSVRVTWTGATGATVTVGRDGTDATGYGPWSTEVPATAGEMSHEFLSLVPTTTYTFTVTDGDVTDTVQYTISDEDPDPEPDVIDVTVTAGQTTADVEWLGATGTEVDVTIEGPGGPYTAATPADAGSHTFTGLTPGSDYTATVESNTGIGTAVFATDPADPDPGPDMVDIIVTVPANWVTPEARIYTPPTT